MYSTGQTVPESGIYRVVHAEHRLPHEVTLLRGEEFPRCCKCSGSVSFEVVRLAPQLTSRNRVILYELPELDPSGFEPSAA